MKTKFNKATKYSIDLANLPPLTPAQKDELAHLSALNERDINLSDAPEVLCENWIPVDRKDLYRPVKQPVTIRLDADILNWFKQHATHGGYQTEINRILRHHVMQIEKTIHSV
jgi:uncharacterized protein (DUF4415 family)